MAEVERGRIDHTIDVYERSEIGQLQLGFNRMVAGLRERDQLRDLFGRHVGEDVVRRAVRTTNRCRETSGMSRSYSSIWWVRRS